MCIYHVYIMLNDILYIYIYYIYVPTKLTKKKHIQPTQPLKTNENPLPGCLQDFPHQAFQARP